MPMYICVDEWTIVHTNDVVDGVRLLRRVDDDIGTSGVLCDVVFTWPCVGYRALETLSLSYS